MKLAAWTVNKNDTHPDKNKFRHLLWFCILHKGHFVKWAKLRPQWNILIITERYKQTYKVCYYDT